MVVTVVVVTVAVVMGVDLVRSGNAVPGHGLFYFVGGSGFGSGVSCVCGRAL
jgi:hypothetical protein